MSSIVTPDKHIPINTILYGSPTANSTVSITNDSAVLSVYLLLLNWSVNCNNPDVVLSWFCYSLIADINNMRVNKS